jgi:hypothetical protein
MRTSAHRAKPSVRLVCEALEDRVTPVLAYALSGTNLLSFDTATPAVATTTAIVPSSIVFGETLVGIAINPSNGQLYALGENAGGTAGTLYTLNTSTGVASAVGSASSIAPTGGPTPPASNGFGLSFNPTNNLIQVTTSTGQSFSINATSAAVSNFPLLNGGSTKANGSAFTNNAPGAAVTTMYSIDASTGKLYTQGPTTSALTLVGTLGPAFTNMSGFSIPAGVNVTTSGALATGTGFAALTVAGATDLYSVDLTAGTATAVGPIGAGTAVVSGLAVTTGGTVSFQSAAYSGNRGSAGVNVVLTRTGGTNPQTVTVSVTGGTAVPGVDFTNTGPYTVSFANGATTATLNIAFVNSSAMQAPKTVDLTISAVGNGTVGVQNTATVTVNSTIQRYARVFGTGSVVPAVGTSQSGSGTVTNIYPYSTSLPTGVRVAVGDLDGDGINDLVVVNSVGAPTIIVYSGATGAQLASFAPYTASIPASIAVGDLNGDGRNEIIVGTASNLSAVFVFSGTVNSKRTAITFSQTGSFLAFGSLPVGVNVAVGDLNGNGKSNIVVSSATGLAVVGVFDGQTFAAQGFFLPFGAFYGGATVAVGDLDNDGKAEIVVGTGSQITAVGVFNGQSFSRQTLLLPFGAIKSGVSVAVNDINGDGIPDLIVGLTTGPDVVNAYAGSSLTLINTLLPFGAFNVGVYVA